MLPCLISLLVKPCSRRGRTTWFPAPWVHQLEHRPVTRFWSGQCRLFFYGFGAAEVGIMYWLAITLLAVLETLGAVGCWAFAKCCHRWTVHGKRMQKQAFDWLSGTFNTFYIFYLIRFKLMPTFWRLVSVPPPSRWKHYWWQLHRWTFQVASRRVSARFNRIQQIQLLVNWTGTSAKIPPRVSDASGKAFGSGFMIMLVLSAQTLVNPPALDGVWWYMSLS